jgi:hypothetical protein
MQTAQPLPGFFGNLQCDDPVYQPRPAPLFRPHCIILTKGCATTPERRAFIEHICAVYPRAEVSEQFEGVRFSPTVKIYVNLDDILTQIDHRAHQIGRPEAFYLGKLQDGMALDPLTGYSRIMIPFFAKHPFARLRILSKCADFANVLDLDHRGHTVLCWSLNPAAVRREFELVTPPIEDRLEAMRRCAEAGYPIRVMLMPIIPIPDWRQHYDELLEQMLTAVPVDRITLGGVCSYGPAIQIMEAKLGKDNLISRSLTVIDNGPADGRSGHLCATHHRVTLHLSWSAEFYDAARGIGEMQNVHCERCKRDQQPFHLCGLARVVAW